MAYFKSRIELQMLLVMSALMLGGPVNNNFVIYRTCYVLMEKNETDCRKLGLNTSDNATNELEKEVEPLANYINMILDMVTLVVPCILCIFIGPWSDKKGRKPILALSLTGFVIANALRTAVAFIPSLSPWYLFIQSVPILLTGGMPTFITIAFCYLIDVTKVESRGMRMGIMEAVIGLGMLLGTFCSTYLFEAVGYVGVFLTCTLLLSVALFSAIFCLEETIDSSQYEDCKFFSLDHIKESTHTTFKPRAGYNRLMLLVCIGSLMIYILAEGNSGTEALLLRSKLHWELKQITTYSTIRALISIGGGFFCIYVLHKIMRIGECALIVPALMLCALCAFFFAFARFDWQIYFAASLRGMSGVVTPMIRSLMSKIIPHDEIGKVFSFGISLESLIAICAGPLYTVIYNNSIDSFPGSFDLMVCGLHVVNVIFYIFIVLLRRRENAIVYLDIAGESRI